MYDLCVTPIYFRWKIDRKLGLALREPSANECNSKCPHVRMAVNVNGVWL